MRLDTTAAAGWFGAVLAQSKRFAAQERLAPRGARARPRGAARARCSPRPRALGRSTASASRAGPVALERMPVLEKAELMERFDDMVTDPALRRDELLEWIATRRRDELFADRYRVMTTSGSSGRKGLFVYDRAGWAAIGAQFLRGSRVDGPDARASRAGGWRCWAARR